MIDDLSGYCYGSDADVVLGYCKAMKSKKNLW